MHYFPCTPDCPLEIWADWLEDHGVDPGEIRLMAQGWCLFGHRPDAVYDYGYGCYMVGFPSSGQFSGHIPGHGYCSGYYGSGYLNPVFISSFGCSWYFGSGHHMSESLGSGFCYDGY